ncbi:hypothetical protein [Arthrobacter sp. ISL-65]|uniref:hypothetical protein n=1 Tax=Arthrobacter sp. ISL-65 TaxID=2819112 RepID=UPI001BEC3BC8|nr:hypothetical protein [Arthrobacter sp. ISL-65]MBT2548774.1 hypothetical protein [Arthrobacter sp. ISL-65]
MTVLASTSNDAAGLDGIAVWVVNLMELAGCAVLASLFVAGKLRKARNKVDA